MNKRICFPLHKVVFLLFVIPFSACTPTSSTIILDIPTEAIQESTAITKTPESTSIDPAVQDIEIQNQLGLGVVYDISWHPDKSKIAIATPLGIRFHHPDTLQELDFWPTNEPVTALLYVSDGMLISGDGIGNLSFWNNNGEKSTLANPSSICSLTISSDETWLAVSSCNDKNDTAERQKIAIWDNKEKHLVGVLYTQSNYDLIGIAFSPQNDQVTIFEKGDGVCKWNLPNLQLVKPCNESFCDGLPCGPYQVVASSDSSRIAFLDVYGSVFDKAWAAEENRLLLIGQCDNCQGFSIKYGPNTKTIVAGVMGEILILDVNSGEVIAQNSQGPALQFEFSPDGKKFVAVTQFGPLTLFETLTGKELARFESYWGEVSSIAISPDNTQLTCGYLSGTINAWNIPKYTQSFSYKTDLAIVKLSYSHDGQQITYRGRPRYWAEYYRKSLSSIISSENGEIVTILEDDKLTPWQNEPPNALSNERKIKAIGHENGEITLFDSNSVELAEFQSQVGRITAIVIFQTETEYWLVAGGEKGIIRLWTIRIEK